MKVIKVEHPLIKHKLGLIREFDVNVKKFRELSSEICNLLTYTDLLIGSVLTGADLSGANLSGVSLSNTDLTEENLRGNDITKSNLANKSANLSGIFLVVPTTLPLVSLDCGRSVWIIKIFFFFAIYTFFGMGHY